MIAVRNLAQWAGLPFEVVAGLPAQAYEELGELVICRDPYIVQDRGG